MKALISPSEHHGDGVRVAQVSDQEFPVAEPLFWVDCPDATHADMVYVDGAFIEYVVPSQPEPEPDLSPLIGNIPVTEV
jgi:hypothetical protein